MFRGAVEFGFGIVEFLERRKERKQDNDADTRKRYRELQKKEGHRTDAETQEYNALSLELFGKPATTEETSIK